MDAGKIASDGHKPYMVETIYRIGLRVTSVSAMNAQCPKQIVRIEQMKDTTHGYALSHLKEC